MAFETVTGKICLVGDINSSLGKRNHVYALPIGKYGVIREIIMGQIAGFLYCTQSDCNKYKDIQIHKSRTEQKRIINIRLYNIRKRKQNNHKRCFSQKRF